MTAPATSPAIIERAPLAEYALLLLLALLWGGSFTLIKVAVETIPPFTTVAARVVLGGFVLLALARAYGHAIPTEPRRWGQYMVQGFIISALPFCLITWAEVHIDSGLTGLLTSTVPLFVFLLTLNATRKAPGLARKFTGVVVGFAGVIAVVGPATLAGLGQNVVAQLAVVGAAFSYALSAMYAGRFAGQPPLLTAGGAMTSSAVMILPLALIVDRPWTLDPSLASVTAVIGLGLASTALAFVVYFRLLRTLGPLGVAMGGYLRAGFAVLLGVILLAEPITASLLVGLALIIGGVAIVNGRPSKSRAAPLPQRPGHIA